MLRATDRASGRMGRQQPQRLPDLAKLGRSLAPRVARRRLCARARDQRHGTMLLGREAAIVAQLGSAVMHASRTWGHARVRVARRDRRASTRHYTVWVAVIASTCPAADVQVPS